MWSFITLHCMDECISVHLYMQSIYPSHCDYYIHSKAKVQIHSYSTTAVLMYNLHTYLSPLAREDRIEAAWHTVWFQIVTIYVHVNVIIQ